MKKKKVNMILVLPCKHNTIPGTYFALDMMVVPGLEKKFGELFSELACIYELNEDQEHSIQQVNHYMDLRLVDHMARKKLEG